MTLTATSALSQNGLVSSYPNLDHIVSEVVRLWPSHEKYLHKNLRARDQSLLEFSEKLAVKIRKLAEANNKGLEHYIRQYQYLCEQIVLPEELYFRRHGKYRLSSFEEAFATVYSNKEFMAKYMDGLLLSDVIWINHAQCMMNFRTEFLTSLPAGADLLEIGPGHGLLLSLADEVDHLGSISAWDVSEASLEMASHSMKVVGAQHDVAFQLRNIFDPTIMAPENAESFDAIVLSEVLEHLENPLGAVQVLHHLCREGGKVWINLPANSPAPDHLYLIHTIEEPMAVVREAGFTIEGAFTYPTNGESMEKVNKNKLTFNCVIIAGKPGKPTP